MVGMAKVENLILYFLVVKGRRAKKGPAQASDRPVDGRVKETLVF